MGAVETIARRVTMGHPTATLTRAEYLRRLLCPFWLRPESALWYAHEVFLVRQYLGEPLRSPSLEFGCMDGAATFVMLGGEFAPEWDVYREVSWQPDSIVWKSRSDDYFDAVAPLAAQVDVECPPAIGFDLAVAWKHAHAVKASRLKIYGQVIEVALGAPLDAHASASFRTIWAPNLYWIDDLAFTLVDLRRLVHPEGRVVTVLPDESAPPHMLYRFVDRADPAWIRDLDRGRFAHVSRQARSLEAWHELFETTGFRVARHERFLPTLVYQVNDIGFRPMFPALMRIYETLRRHSMEDWLAVKTQWMETAFHFLAPLCDTDWMDRLGMPRVWHVFELHPAAGSPGRG